MMISRNLCFCQVGPRGASSARTRSMQGCAETIVALCASMFRANARPA